MAEIIEFPQNSQESPEAQKAQQREAGELLDAKEGVTRTWSTEKEKQEKPKLMEEITGTPKYEVPAEDEHLRSLGLKPITPEPEKKKSLQDLINSPGAASGHDMTKQLIDQLDKAA